MALTVTFGNGGASTVSSLTNLVDQEAYELLTESTTQTKIGSSLDTGVVNVGAVTVPGSGTGGKVDVGYNAGTNGFTFDVSSAWNSVKNALAKSDSSENLSFKDFVQVDVHLGGTGSSSVEVLNAKRGNISTGAGNDTVVLSVVSNDKGWVNAFNIDTGAGNDTITVKAGTAFNDASGSGIVGTQAVNGGAGVTDGSFTSVKIDAGDGNDTIDLSGVKLASSLVTGGKGIDHIIASSGADTFVFNLGDMAKSLPPTPSLVSTPAWTSSSWSARLSRTGRCRTLMTTPSSATMWMARTRVRRSSFRAFTLLAATGSLHNSLKENLR